MRMTLSRAAEQTMEHLAADDRAGVMTPFKFVDFRIYPMLTSKGYVAHNIYSGICLTPIGRKFWCSYIRGRS